MSQDEPIDGLEEEGELNEHKLVKLSLEDIAGWPENNFELHKRCINVHQYLDYARSLVTYDKPTEDLGLKINALKAADVDCTHIVTTLAANWVMFYQRFSSSLKLDNSSITAIDINPIQIQVTINNAKEAALVEVDEETKREADRFLESVKNDSANIYLGSMLHQNETLEKIYRAGTLVDFSNALENLNDSDRDKFLAWLSMVCPENVTFIMSSRLDKFERLNSSLIGFENFLQSAKPQSNVEILRFEDPRDPSTLRQRDNRSFFGPFKRSDVTEASDLPAMIGSFVVIKVRTPDHM